MSQLFTSGGQSIGNSVLPTALPMNVQGWIPLGMTGLISLQSKWFSRDGYSSPINKWAPWDLETLNSFNKLTSPVFRNLTHVLIYLITSMYSFQYNPTLPRSDQIRSVAQLFPTLCDPMNLSTPGLPVHHRLPEFTETHIHPVSDAIQPSHPLSSPSPLAPNPSQHQSLLQWVNSSHEVAKVLEFQL